MNLPSRSTLALALMLALGATACSDAAEQARQTADEAKQTISDATAEGGAVSEAIAEAREKLRTENLPIAGIEGLPKAEVTPQGDLLIEGVAVPINAEQRAAVLAYRAEVLSVADTGMAMGARGAAIAGDALALAAKGFFGADTTEAEAEIEAQGKAMAKEAEAICLRVEALKLAGDRLAAVLPAFKPYADKMKFEAKCDTSADDAEAPADDAAAEEPTVSV